MALPISENINDLLKEAANQYLEQSNSIFIDSIIQTVSILGEVDVIIKNHVLVQTVSLLDSIVSNGPLVQTVSFLDIPYFNINNSPLVQTVSFLQPISTNINNGPLIQTVSLLDSIVSNSPLIQTVSFLDIPYFNINNSPLIQTVSLLTGSEIRVNNTPLVQTVSIIGGLTVSVFSGPTIIGNTITSHLLYSGNMLSTISVAVNVLGFGEHLFYFNWNGQVQNSTRANIEHNIDTAIGGQWSLLIDQRSPSGNTLRTNSFAYRGILSAIRLNLSPAGGSGNVTITSFHRYN